MARGIYFLTTENPIETLDVLFPWKYILSTSSNHYNCNNNQNSYNIKNITWIMLETVSTTAELN